MRQLDAAYKAGHQVLPNWRSRVGDFRAHGFKVDLITQSFQPTHQIAFQSLWFQALEVIRSQFLIGRITAQDVVNRDQDFFALRRPRRVYALVAL